MPVIIGDPLNSAHRTAFRTMYNAQGLNTSWPGGAPNITLARAQQLLSAPNKARAWVNGSTIETIINCRPYTRVPTETCEEMWLAIWTGSLPLLTLRANAKALMIDWWTDLQTRGIQFGYGKNLPVYPAKFEDFFQRLVAAGMPVEVTSAGWRVVKMRPAQALAVLGAV